jgi:integrase
MTIGLTTLVERYLTERRTLGFQLRSAAYSLRSLAEYVRRTRHRGPLTLEVMAEWARLDSHASVDPRTWARRLKQLRSFARWMQQFEPATEVPDDTIFGRLPERQAPHIYSPEEVQQLLAAARELGPSPGLRGLIYETLFGLIASCGLRLSEALSLTVADVDLRRGVLTIRRTKFAKSRQVPLHPSTAKALGRYRWTRDLAGASRDDDAPFFIGTRGRLFGKRSAFTRWTTSSPSCATIWAGSTAAPTTRRASTTCGTPSWSGASCCGNSTASTWTRRCSRCRPTSGTRWSPTPTGTCRRCRS